MKLPQHLPHIDGVRGAVVRTLYWLLALPVAAAILIGTGFIARDTLHNFPATMQYGFRTYTYVDAGPAIGGLTPRGEAAGLRLADHIVAVNDKPLPAKASEFTIGNALDAAKGADVRLTLRGTDRQMREVTLHRDPAPWVRTDPRSGFPLWAYALITFIVSQSLPIVLVAVSTLLVLRRPRDPEALLFAFALVLLTQQNGSLWWWPGAPLSSQALQNGWLCGWMLAFVAISGFPGGRFVSRTARITATLGGLMLAVFVTGQTIAAFLGELPKKNQALMVAWFLMTAVGAIAALLIRYRATPAGPERQQIKWAVGGFTVTLVAFLVLLSLEIVQLIDNGNGSAIAFAAVSLLRLLATLGVPLGLIFSLLRYRLYDAEATMSRSTVYAALTVALLFIFAATEKTVEGLGQNYFGGELGAIAGGVGAALAAVMIAPLHHKLSEWSERRFQRALVALRQGLPLLVGDMRETAPLPELARAVVKRVENGVRVRQVALLVGGQMVAAAHVEGDEVAAWQQDWTPNVDEGLECDRHDPLFPLRLPLDADGCGRVGWLLLGPRPDGSLPGKDEREALAAVADPVARAIHVVRQREASGAAYEARIGALEAAVARLLGRAAPA